MGNYRNFVTNVISDPTLADDVRRHDYDRYFCTLFAPDDRRLGLIALLALNLELARVRERVSEATLGQIRLAWWHETIEGIFEGKPRQHPVARALADSVARHDISRASLDSMIEARSIEFEEQGFPTLESLERFADQTSGALHRSCLRVLEVEAPEIEASVGHVGTAWALVGLVRSVPVHAKLGRLYLPRDALAKAQLSASEILSLTSGARLKPVIETVIQRASQHLRAARESLPKAPRQALPVLLPAILADSYLTRIRRHNYDPFALPGETNRLMGQLRLLWASVRKTY